MRENRSRNSLDNAEREHLNGKATQKAIYVVQKLLHAVLCRSIQFKQETLRLAQPTTNRMEHEPRSGTYNIAQY